MGFEAGFKWGCVFSFLSYNDFSPQDLRPSLLFGQLDSPAGPGRGDRTAGPQHLGPVCCCCQCTLLAWWPGVGVPFRCLSPDFSEVNSVWKVFCVFISVSEINARTMSLRSHRACLALEPGDKLASPPGFPMGAWRLDN